MPNSLNTKEKTPIHLRKRRLKRAKMLKLYFSSDFRQFYRRAATVLCFKNFDLYSCKKPLEACLKTSVKLLFCSDLFLNKHLCVVLT